MKRPVRILLPWFDGGDAVTAQDTQHVADVMEAWFTQRACDGFQLMTSHVFDGLDAITDKLIPELQRRGLFRTEYTGAMLREHYGLGWPASVFDDPAFTVELRGAAAGI